MKFFDKLRKNSNANILSAEQHENLLNNNGLSYFSQQGTLNRMIVQGQEQFFKNMSNRKSVLDDIPDSSEIDVKINNEFINDQALKKYGTSRQDFVPEGSQWFPRMRNSEPKGGDGDADSLNSYSSVKYFFWCVSVCTKAFFAKKGSKINFSTSVEKLITVQQ